MVSFTGSLTNSESPRKVIIEKSIKFLNQCDLNLEFGGKALMEKD